MLKLYFPHIGVMAVKEQLILQKLLLSLCENSHQKMQYAYEDTDTLIEKINKVAKKIYRASEIIYG